MNSNNEKQQEFNYIPLNPVNDIFNVNPNSHDAMITSLIRVELLEKLSDYKHLKSMDLEYLTSGKEGSIGFWSSDYRLIKKRFVNLSDTAVLQVDYMVRDNLVVTMNGDSTFKFFELNYRLISSKFDLLPLHIIHIERIQWISFWIQNDLVSPTTCIKALTKTGDLVALKCQPDWHSCTEVSQSSFQQSHLPVFPLNETESHFKKTGLELP